MTVNRSSPNRQRALEVDVELVAETAPPVDLDLDAVRRLVSFVLAGEAQSGSWSVAVVLTDDGTLRRLHRDFLEIDTETDVMTFPAEDGSPVGTDRRGGGDIVVSVERATDQAPAFGHGTAAEVRFLVVHGLLHLCGWDDGDDAARERMLNRQGELLAMFDAHERQAGTAD